MFFSYINLVNYSGRIVLRFFSNKFRFYFFFVKNEMMEYLTRPITFIYFYWKFNSRQIEKVTHVNLRIITIVMKFINVMNHSNL